MNEFEKLQGPEDHPIRKLTQKYGIKTYKLAYYLGVSVSHCSRILHGQYAGGPRVRRKLERLYEHLKAKGE